MPLFARLGIELGLRPTPVARREALAGTVPPPHLFDKGRADPELFRHCFYRPLPRFIGIDDRAPKI
jgi:hypothetical protein